MAPLTFRKLKKALEENDEAIVALGKDKDGGIKIVKNYGEGSRHSVALTIAKGHASENPDILFIQAL